MHLKIVIYRIVYSDSYILFFLYSALSPMIAAAKQLALSPDNKVVHAKWQQTNNEVCNQIFLLIIIDFYSSSIQVNRCYWNCS